MNDEQPSSDSLRRIKHIFLSALNMKPEQREDFIRSACSEESDCIQKTLELLELHFKSGSILDSSLEQLIDDVDSKIGDDDD